jgi:hypothetical protein
MIEKRTIEVTDLEEVIFLINHEVPIFMELAAYFMHIKDDIHPWGGGNSFFLSGKAERDFNILCEAGAIGGLETGKSYLAQFCLWNPEIHGEQTEKGKALAKKFGLGEEFVDFEVKREGIKEYIINDTDPEDFLKELDEQVEQARKYFNKPIEPKEFTHKYIGTCEDGRVKVKITCHNEWLDEEVSVITNNDQIGISPFGTGHIAKLNVHGEEHGLVVLYGYFSEDNLREADENLYIEGICDSLIDGATESLFGSYHFDIPETEDIKPLRQLNFEDVKTILHDPWRVLVVDSLSCGTVICTSGEGIYDIIEEVFIDQSVSGRLKELAEENVIFYGSLNDAELKERLPTPHFYELWNEDAYGPQPDEAFKKAKLIGLEENLCN